MSLSNRVEGERSLRRFFHRQVHFVVFIRGCVRELADNIKHVHTSYVWVPHVADWDYILSFESVGGMIRPLLIYNSIFITW